MVSSLCRSVVSTCSSGTNRPTCLKTSCPASVHRQAESVSSRRAVLKGLGVGLLTVTTPNKAWSVAKPQSTNVGSYLPEADTGFVQFQPSDTQTPAIRAGVIKANNAYRFVLPNSWSEQRIANIQSGNFCMPRCDEPWQEVVFANPSEGTATLYVMNKRRLTNRAEATIDKIGPPTGIIQSLGPFITGTYLDEDDLVAADKIEKSGRTYYKYEANSISGKGGPHYVAVATTKDDLLYLFTLSASEPQWKKAQPTLKRVVDSFVV